MFALPPFRSCVCAEGCCRDAMIRFAALLQHCQGVIKTVKGLQTKKNFDDQIRGIVAALSRCRLVQKQKGKSAVVHWDSVRTIIIIVLIMIHGAVIICRYTCTLLPGDRMHLSRYRGVCVPAACTLSSRKIANRNDILGSGMVLVRLSGCLSAWSSPECTGVQYASFL